jgi:hypothetical protein
MGGAKKLLITCPSLTDRTGLEIFVSEIARGLVGRGWEVTVFAPTLGELARRAAAQGVKVVDDISRAQRPDVIHGTFYFESILACLALTNTPLLYQTHAAQIWMSLPPKIANLRTILAVDDACAQSIRDAGFDRFDVVTSLNFADTDVFQPRPPLPARPARALIYSNYAEPNGYADVVQRRCAALGVEVDVAGSRWSSLTESPQTLLPQYDIVFAKGRSAIEAMAVGCAVMPCDCLGVGPMVTTQNLAALRRLNFGWRTLTTPHDTDYFDQQLASYDPADAAAVRDVMRREATLTAALDQLEAQYHATIHSSSAAPVYSHADLCADVEYRMKQETQSADRYSAVLRSLPLMLFSLISLGRERDRFSLRRFLRL